MIRKHRRYTADDLMHAHLVDAGVSMFGGITASREDWAAVVDGGPGMVRLAPGVVVM